MIEGETATIHTADQTAAITAMFEVGAHYGYTRSKRHPTVAPFIYGTKNQVEIFDLEKTLDVLAPALAFVAKVAGEGKQLLFVGTKHEAQGIVSELADSIDMPYVTIRWIGGTLTNFATIRGRVDKLGVLLAQRDSGELAQKYTKKERLLIDRDIVRLERNFGGITGMKEKPAVMFMIDPKKEQTAVREARQVGIPIIALAGSDCNLKEVDYPIPANDSSRSSIHFFTKQITDAYKKGHSGKA
ncbi:MAG: small subunit ribosomal protein S2 [Parcubacteria group bacterium Gr01-1014_48]|nr:MAG: small subunit ribosomal protein S2 [Parcubacteria group bacterium Greene0416_14]TSC74078.1 MAG: small subunit ribosomal protein S2 [Parcubacteria group bacterium Gr01-1014_48]TSD01135.1 MAG: small subunit ribosomal protein S2 [Parcubacteria group bacterium Greene1014_15]TSD08211.1 MAG: small subunit ribosomal protein S2 [Parcubacteria group bacterium Greene0714_4]